MEFKHFSHEHPLTLNEGKGWHALTEIIDPKQTCKGCGESILPYLPFYLCHDCNYFLHQRCAHLPLQTIYPLHHQDHRLTLLSRPPSRHSRRTNCNACNRSDWQHFTYHCPPCNFNIDIECAIRATTRVQHKCHKHPLIPLQSPAKFHCDACKSSEFEGPSYLCTICQFWVHQVCADWLPTTLKYQHQSSIGGRNAHDHPLILSYTFPRTFHKFVAFCEICFEKLSRPDWVYYCPDCRYFAHPSCCIPIISRNTIKEEKPALPAIVEKETHLIDSNNSIVRLPFIEEFRDPIAVFIQSISLGDHDHDHESIKHPSHGHQLSLTNIEREDDDHILDERMNDNNEVCKGCYSPIYSTSFYKCNEDPNCNFLLHKWCSKLPKQIIDHPCHPQHPLILTTDIYGMIRCNGCKKLCLGFTFSCESCQFHLDVGCASLPRFIIHDLHDHSKLTLKEYKSTDGFRCNGCNYLLCGMAFACEVCNNFKVDKECVLLSRAIRHRYDEKHPYKLMYSPVPGIEEYLCEICEKAINPRQCFYCCGLCDQAIHPNCVLPFGRAISAYNPGMFLITPHHPHRIPMRESIETHGATCDCCGEGFFAGKMSGFECILCSFKIHMECVDTPQLVKLRCDEHSLRLIYPASSSSIESGIGDCKVCQREIDRNIWFFHCSQCDVSVHRLCV
ncbi:uncharacterized protein LOC124920961 [Impatiens glandulifera]|uniref:uncharacterized protein LOC124920961 n=1 Tax=Impatiens glandulifera TaxID=253017 RepID=UPI001FB104E9|nr:uncharacterized protein LOC124920961 [Impatiens glandulifera]